MVELGEEAELLLPELLSRTKHVDQVRVEGESLSRMSISVAHCALRVPFSLGRSWIELSTEVRKGVWDYAGRGRQRWSFAVGQVICLQLSSWAAHRGSQG